MQDDQKAFEQFKKSSMNKLGKFLWKTRTIVWYRDGTFFSPSFRWWHPLTWLHVVLFLILLVPMCASTNLSVKEALKQLWEALTVSDFFKKNPDKLRWYNEEK